MQLENIEPIIMNWFENNPELYKYAYSNNPFTSEKMDDTFLPIGLTCYIPDQDKKYQKDFDEYLASSDYLEDEQLFKTKRSLEIQLRNHLDKITYVDEFLILAQICNKYSEPLPSYLKSEDKQQMRSPAYGKTMGAF